MAATYPGHPPEGTLYWGAAIHGNGDPVSRHEKVVGASLSIRRTFFQWRDRATKMIRYAKDDIAHNRLPWVSVKTPGWEAMAGGEYDAQIDEMLDALEALPGPVWLTVWHEPEGGGGKNYPDDPAGPSGHVAMNRQVRSRMTALTSNARISATAAQSSLRVNPYEVSSTHTVSTMVIVPT